MSKVSITRSLLDDLATSISAKSGEPVPMTLTEMKDAVDDIQVGSTTIESLSVTENGTYTAQTGHAYSPVTVNVSGGTPRTSTDLVVSGATVTAPAGVYATDASKSVASGTAGTPTATKGTVSNHSVSVTPSVTNTSGYITGSTKTGTAVTVSASELVSGTYNVTSSGTKDVTNYASASVPSGTEGTPTATKGTVSNHSVSVTPSVTNTSGFITGGTKTGTAVTVTASELASGNKAITENGTDIDVVGYSTVSVDVQGGGSITWETMYDSSATIVADNPNYIVISNWTPSRPAIADGQTWRVTWKGTEYVCPVKIGAQSNTAYVGNAQIVGGSDESNEPFFGYMRTSTQLAFVTTDAAGTITLKMELQQSSSATLIEKTITTNGTYDAEDDDADGYSSVTVNVSSGTPTIQSLTVAPSTTQQTFNASGVDGYKPVTVSAVSQTNLTADNIKNGTTVTISNGTSNLWSVTGTYSGGGSSMNVQVAQSTSRASSSTYTNVISLTCSTAGKYDIYWDCFRSSTGGTNGSQLYINGVAQGTANTTFTNHIQNNHSTNVTLAKNDVVAVYARSRGSNYYAYVGTLTIKQTA